MVISKRKPRVAASKGRLLLSEIFLFEQRVSMMVDSREIVDIFDCIFFSNMTFPLTMLKIQSQKNLILSSEQFKMKHIFNTTGKLVYKSNV